jgi:plastocyanin
MSKKRKNKRDGGKQRPEKGDAGVRLQADGKSAEAQPRPGGGSGEAYEERRARQKREWATQKKQRERKPLPVALFAWLAAGGAGIAAVVVVAFLLLGGSGSGGTTEPTPTVDPRVSGQPIAATFEIEADDDGQSVNPRFTPNTITGKAGDVIELKITNVGSVAHNLRVSGTDKEYQPDAPTSDDFATDALQAGDELSLLVKIDAAGAYPFRCDLHPLQQTGTLILN